MKEVKINSTKINEVNKEVVFEPQLICIDSTDVRFALMGKSGVMYQEAKSAGESIPDFMNKFFDELKSICGYYGVSEEEIDYMRSMGYTYDEIAQAGYG